MDVIIQSSLSTNATSVIWIPPLYSPVCQQMPLLLYDCHNTVQSINKVPFCYMDCHNTVQSVNKVPLLLYGLSLYSPVCQQMPLLLYGCHNTVQSVNKCHFCYMDVIIQSSLSTKCHFCYMDVIIQSSLSTNATSVIWMS